MLTAAIAAPSAQAFHLKYNADLDELNNSGVNGEAELEFLTGDGDRVNLDAGEGPEDVTDLQVGINATGLEPNMLHPQHTALTMPRKTPSPLRRQQPAMMEYSV